MTRRRAEHGARRVPPALPVVPLALAVLVAAVGCGTPEGRWAREAAAERAAAAGAARGFNPADVMFLQMMVVHNGQGVELARLARGRGVREEVGTLAAAIAATQEAETAAMAGRLRDWGQPPTAPPDGHAAHGGMPETADREIASVADAAPADFERAFLNMMIAHQDDAAQLARGEAAMGLHPEVRALAGRIEASRAAQIERMLTLLGG
ncbi:DUF305 domain-containing protein [Planomonospora sp. ID82291]|uniref:DUF305 domain-containing protein n=1 Tax=Planomonospora sp. ID82291 TaxID=2738136 RepID=UPI0018C3D9B0|nr:DUF305 domain-containing protein [Planomonospora sp. ID82291]MBG0815496.1 DUF305 domain-containing protein [Planomonospora sp. ID82291]